MFLCSPEHFFLTWISLLNCPNLGRKFVTCQKKKKKVQQTIKQRQKNGSGNQRHGCLFAQFPAAETVAPEHTISMQKKNQTKNAVSFEDYKNIF